MIVSDKNFDDVKNRLQIEIGDKQTSYTPFTKYKKLKIIQFTIFLLLLLL